MPATIIIQRPAFTDQDVVLSAPFNQVTILSAAVPDATSGSGGVICIAGDLTGDANGPQLVVTGVTADTFGGCIRIADNTALAALTVITADIGVRIVYVKSTATYYQATTVGSGLDKWTVYTPPTVHPTRVAVIKTDLKGRIVEASSEPLFIAPTSANTQGVIKLATDLAGTADNPELASCGVEPGAYNTIATVADETALAALTVDASVTTTASPTTLAALTVISGDIGTRRVRVTSTGQYFLAFAVGTGADKWRRTYGDIGRRLVRVTAGSTNANGSYYTANAAGSGFTKWTLTTQTPIGSIALPQITLDAKGRVTSISHVPISLIAEPNKNVSFAWARFDGAATTAYKTGNYTRTSNVVTVNVLAHGLRTGDSIYLDFASGITDGLFTVLSTPTADSFTVASTGTNITSTAVTLILYSILNSYGVSSITQDPRGGTSYWANMTADAPNAEYLLIVTGQTRPGSWVAAAEENSNAGVSYNTTRGFSIYCGHAPGRINALVYT